MYACSILLITITNCSPQGYAVSVAIVTTGIASRFLFNTQLSMHFWSIPRPCDIQVHVK